MQRKTQNQIVCDAGSFPFVLWCFHIIPLQCSLWVCLTAKIYFSGLFVVFGCWERTCSKLTALLFCVFLCVLVLFPYIICLFLKLLKVRIIQLPPVRSWTLQMWGLSQTKLHIVTLHIMRPPLLPMMKSCRKWIDSNSTGHQKQWNLNFSCSSFVVSLSGLAFRLSFKMWLTTNQLWSLLSLENCFYLLLWYFFKKLYIVFYSPCKMQLSKQ